MRYRCVDAHKAAGFPVVAACQAARVSASAFYAWVAKREQGPRAAEHAQAELVANLRAIHAESGGTYGSPRVSHQLRRRGWRVNHKRVERLMAAHGLVGHRPCHRRGLAVAGVGHRPGLPPPARLVDGRAPRRWPGHRCAPGRRGHPRSEQNGFHHLSHRPRQRIHLGRLHRPLRPAGAAPINGPHRLLAWTTPSPSPSRSSPPSRSSWSTAAATAPAPKRAPRSSAGSPGTTSIGCIPPTATYRRWSGNSGTVTTTRYRQPWPHSRDVRPTGESPHCWFMLRH
jgi:HTH-like domain